MGRWQTVGRKYPLIPFPPLPLSSAPSLPPPKDRWCPNLSWPVWPWPCTCSSQEGSLQCSLLGSYLGLGVRVTRKVNNLVGCCDILRWNTAPPLPRLLHHTPTFCAPSPTRGSAIAKIVGGNAAKLANFDSRVTMWVFEEDIGGRKLTEIINTQHENVKYLPGHKLPSNVVSPNTL